MQQKDNKTINNHNKRSKEREEGEIDLSLTELPFSIVSDLFESWLPETETVATVEAISTPAAFPVGMKRVNFINLRSMTGQSLGARASTFAYQRIAGAARIEEVGRCVSPPSSIADWNERAACSCAHVPQSNSHHQQLLQGLLQLLHQHQHQALLPQDREPCLAKLCEQRQGGLPLEPEVRPKRSRCGRLFPAPPVRRVGCF